MSNSTVNRTTVQALNWAGQLKLSKQQDFIDIFGKLTGEGFAWDSVDQVLVKPNAAFGRFLSADTPWCHVKSSPYKNCNFDHSIVFTHFGIIPPRCLECWKVTVSPKSYHELRLLEDLQQSSPYPCKCGIELRQYVPKHYGGYFYNNSLDEGRECYEWVLKAVKEQFGDDRNVLLKRGCTEYEFLKGPSPFWVMTPEEEKKLELIQAYVRDDRGNGSQPDLVKNHIRLRWAQWAHSNGDMSYKDYNGGEALYPDYVKYHQGSIDGIKSDLAMAKSQAKIGLDPKITREFQELAQQFSDKHKLSSPTLLIHALGAQELNPLKAANFTDIPKEVVGEQDELT